MGRGPSSEYKYGAGNLPSFLSGSRLRSRSLSRLTPRLLSQAPLPSPPHPTRLYLLGLHPDPASLPPSPRPCAVSVGFACIASAGGSPERLTLPIAPPEMEDGASSRNLVIKVKYGDSLRRFLACVNGSSIDHDMSILRSKIISLFKFSPDADLVLQYTDVDGDLVTLETDEELCDAIINQSLNPLRITVQLNQTRSEPSDTDPLSSISAELSALQDQINFTVKEALKTVPEPVQDVLSSLSQDFLSKTAASAPMFTDIVEYLSKLGPSNQYPSQASSSGTSGSRGGATNQSDLNLGNTTNSPVAPGDLLLDVTLVQQGNSDDNMPKNLGQFEVVKMSPTSRPETSIHTDSIPIGSSTDDGRLETNKKDANPRNLPTGLLPVPGVGQEIGFRPYEPPVSGTASGTATERSNNEQSLAVLDYGSGENSLFNTQAIDSSLQTVPSDGSPCPFISYGRRHFMHPTNLSPTVHMSVICDGCGMRPIVGPRYKSNVRHDYDLCGLCFLKMGNDKDYVCIDQAAPPYRSPRPVGGCYSNPHAFPFRGPRMRSSRVKLESRFVQDVTVMDGTLVAPCTPFTKIWRMHNSGAIPWPRGTQLLWIGGDQLANRSFVELEVPENGFPVNTEVDVAVDCIAPSMPGRYTSYWRLTTPFGQKFGQRVWVQIQVDNGHGPTASAYGYQADIDLNVYPQNEQGLPWMTGSPFEPNGNSSNNFPDFGDLSVGPTKHAADRTQDGRSSETTLSDNGPPAGSKSAQVIPVVSGATPTNLYVTVAPASPGSTPDPTTVNPSVVPLAPQTMPVPPPVYKIPPPAGPKFVPQPPLPAPDSIPLPPLPVLVPNPSLAVSKNGAPSPTALENQIGKTVAVPSGSAETIPLPLPAPEMVSVPPPPAPKSVSVKLSPTPGSAALSSYPLIDPAPSSSTAPQSASVPPSEPTPDSDLELQLLKELEGMGFKEVEVNKKILRKNEYDLEKTIDDLCGVSEWDPLLNELRDMGFWDEELNKKLLIKNGGSIKRVVLDLINGKTK